MKYTDAKPPMVCMMTQSNCYKNTSKMKPLGILWHTTGANNPSLKRYVQPDDNAKNKAELLKLLGTNQYGNDWNHQPDRRAGVNAWIGKLADGSVTTVQVLPWDYKPWGCGAGSKGTCNDAWIQFEICEDALTDKAYFEKTYEEAAQLTAYLCKKYGIDPNGTVTFNGVKVPTILCHADAYDLKLGSNHGDIYLWYNKYKVTMKDVRNRVAEIMNSKKEPTQSVTPPSTGTTNTFKAYKVQVTANALNYRKGPGTNYAINGTIRDKGIYTIVEEAKDSSGNPWGKLKSGAGWIILKYTKKV